MPCKTLLVVAAHPDDEILGCGATVAKLVKEGWTAYTLILGEGVTSRDKKRSIVKWRGGLDKLKDQAEAANKIIGVEKVFFGDYPDNRFDSVPLLDITKTVERVKNEVIPEIVFTHSRKDLNVDHRVAYNAVMTATRPVPKESVKRLYSFPIASSTEWNYPTSFSPNYFVDIAGKLSRKIASLKEYSAEMRNYPHPRSLEAVKAEAHYWGSRVGIEVAEPFEVVRVIE